jgi:hypothetical protein
MAKSMNGKARPMKTKHSYYRSLLLEAASTNVPTIGPVQEKDCIRKSHKYLDNTSIPLTVTLLAQELGSIISNAPKNEAAKNH